MGLFNKLFGSGARSKEEKVLPWQALISVRSIENYRG